MPKLTIDHRDIEVAEGTKVIEAAEKLGIMIPRFCYHPALGSVGACRVCAVRFLQGPIQGVQMSCMIDAQDGMVVSTDDEEAVNFRKDVIEWLMLNHPHDCPVCDEGGHCLLQDMTVSGGHGRRRYQGNKRTHSDQYLGPLVQHEMNRCIQCYRCSRYYREFSGYDDLGVMGSAARVYFGRYKEGTLQSPFAGNLIDVCPTGVYTDKPSRYKGRRWDFERRPSVCIHCSLGCRTIASARYREIVRQEADYCRPVNGHFICDRGRYGFYYDGLAQRPRSGTIDSRKVPAEEALQAAVERFTRLEEIAGPSAVAAIGSLRSSFDTQVMLRQVCRHRQWEGPAFWTDRAESERATTAVSRLDEHSTRSLRELEDADCILVIAADPLSEAPMAAMAMRQARRKGAAVAVVDPRPISLPFDFIHLAPAPAEIETLIGVLVKKSVDQGILQSLGEGAVRFHENLPDAGVADSGTLSAILGCISNSRRPVIVCGGDIISSALLADLAADYARCLTAMGKKAGLFYLLQGANAFGAAVLAGALASVEQVLECIENEKIRALLIVESDPFGDFPDRDRLKRAVEKLDLLVTLDYIDSPAMQAAHVGIPTATLFENGGLYINQEGRLQRCHGVYRGGMPVVQDGGGGHPPRVFRSEAPGGGIEATWQSLARLGGTAADSLMRAALPLRSQGAGGSQPLEYSALVMPGTIPPDGLRLAVTEPAGSPFSYSRSDQGPATAAAGDGFELMAVSRVFGTERLSALSPCLKRVKDRPRLWMHTKDAAALGLSDGADATIELDQGRLALQLSLSDAMAPGTLFIPRDSDLDWQALRAFKIHLERDRIRKTNRFG